MTLVNKLNRLEQLVGGAALLFLATLFNTHGMRLLCLALALKIVTLSPQDQTQSKRLAMVGLLSMISIYFGSLPGLFCLVIADFANKLLSPQTERRPFSVTDFALESCPFIPLLLALVFDLLRMELASEICIYLSLGLRLTQWPLALLKNQKDEVDRVTIVLFGIAIVKMLPSAHFPNWMVGGVVLTILSGLTLSLSGSTAMLFAFLTILNPNCAVFAAAALFCVDHERMPSLFLSTLFVPAIFLIHTSKLFGEQWWVLVPILLWSLRGCAQASFKIMSQRRQEDFSAVLVGVVLLAMGIYVLRKDFGPVFVSDRMPEFVLSGVALLAMPIWTTLGKVKSPVARNISGFRLQGALDLYMSKLHFGPAPQHAAPIEISREPAKFDLWTSMERGPVFTLLGFVTLLIWGIYWATR